MLFKEFGGVDAFPLCLDVTDVDELVETVVRLGLPMLIVVYNDEAYGAEVHHFGPDGHPLDTVRFPAADVGPRNCSYGLHGELSTHSSTAL